MSKLKIIEDIEKNLPVESIEAGNMQVWPFLKIYFGNLLISNLGAVDININIFKSFFRSFHYGFFNLFRRYDYIIFSGSSERKMINNQLHDKSIDFISQSLDKALVFELPIPVHYPKKDIPTKYIASKYILYLLIHIRSKLFFRAPIINNEQLLQDILNKHNIKLDYKSLIKKHLAQHKIMSFLIRIYKPKAVFFVCSYTHMAFIKALKDRGIKVIEIQHGVINKNHLAYNLYKKLDSNFYPDYLLTFGKKEKEVFAANNFFIKESNVLTAGHLYIDYIAGTYSGDTRFKALISGYKKAVAITADGIPLDATTFEFLKKAAQIDKNIIYIYIPRNKFTKKAFTFNDNIKVVDWLNCYEIMAQCDFHSTVYSTCALEAPSVGIQNILINLNNLSKTHYDSVLNNKEITRYVKTPEEYVETINNFKMQEKEYIINANRDIIVPGYKENIKEILNLVLEH